MRYVAIGCLREGMILAKSLYSVNNDLLLSRGQKLIISYIIKLKQLGYQGIYIEDDISKDIEIENVIKDELRQKTINTVKDVFQNTRSGNKRSLEKSIGSSKRLVCDMVDQILDKRNTMLNIIDLKTFDDYTYYHSVNVAVLAISLGVAMGYNSSRLYNLGLGALFHDVGKVFIPKELLNKSAKLTDEEFKQIKEHPQLGCRYLVTNFSFSHDAYNTVMQHHERFDGSGYPFGLQGDQITQNGKIIAISDVYDAMVSDRPYRKALPRAYVLEYIVSQNRTMFDPDVVHVFTRKIAPYPVGTFVYLSNGEKGIVIRNYEFFGNRPSVRIIDGKGKAVRDVCLKDDKRYLNVVISGSDC